MSDRATDLALLPALELRRLIGGGDVSVREVAAACLSRIEAVDPFIQSFVTLVDEERILATAEKVQTRIKEGVAPPLAGVPYALKDLTETAGIRTTFGSRIRAQHVPAEDAAVARRLREAGGVLLGKTNTPEFGNRATTAFGLFPPTHNPWDLGKTAGGSSGGSAAAVAACLCPFAEGSDGGGSIRIPSSCCGVVGIKPSRGRVSNAPNSNPRGGLITHGPIARTVADAALMLDVMAGYEPGDPFVAPQQAPSFLSSAERDPQPLRVGLLLKSDKSIDHEVVAAVQKTARALESLGHQVEEADVALTGLGPLFRVMVEAESAANEVEDPSSFSDPYSTWCYERGSRLTAKEYIKATEEMFRRSREIIVQSSRWNCLLTPTVTLTPQPLDQFLAVTERVAEDDLAYIPFTYPFNITGQPGISLPLGWSKEGLPIGVQLVGQPYGESLIIALAAQLERTAPWRSRYPPTASHNDEEKSFQTGN
ncbi:MAG TPA: amidase [Roseiarcus sp.]|nr:amidase [Roseiarcus sp.]